MNYFSICCIVKNEDLYIEEWINFHRATGVDHIYIYDNDSSIPLKQTLKKYIDKNVVSVIDFPGKLKQIPAYQHCLDNFGSTTKWLGFVDADEFIVPKNDNIKDLLKDYEKYGALVANWLFFASSGHLTKPNGLVIENFIHSSHKNWCLNNHVKSILQPQFVSSTVPGDPHQFKYKPNYFSVNEEFKRIDGSITFKCKGCWVPNTPEEHHCGEVITNKIQVHHYYTKSKEEHMIRYNGGSCNVLAEKRSTPEAFDSLTRICNLENKEALRFLDKTKELMSEI